MVPDSRRAARAADAQQTPPDEKPRRRRGRVIGIVIGSVLVVVLAVGVWVGLRALTVKNELEAAQNLIASLDDGTPMDERVAAIGEHASAAADAAADPVWRGLEWIPAAGENLRAVRLASESLDVLANDLGGPALSAMQTEGEGSSIGRLLPVLQEQAPRVSELAREVSAAAQSTSLIGPVRSGIDQVDDALQVAAPAVEAGPLLLGADGAKNYLLVFQNNAESVGLGGSAASQSLVTADAGNIEITAQAGSGDFDNGNAVDVPVDQSALALYTDYLVTHVNTAPSRPDFPTAAQILRAFWQRDIAPDHIDAVISIDPLALARVLKATGPITLGDVEITEQNAVQILLSDVYSWWDPYASREEAAASDAFFAAVAQTVFTKVSSGDFNIKDMLWAVNYSIESGDIMMWSDDDQISQLVGDGRLSGALPADNGDSTTVGVFFRDTSMSKIDYYMDSAVDVTESCEAGTHTFTTATSLHLNISQEDADNLPRYVASGTWGSEKFRTEVFVYGPPGTTVVEASVDGRDVRPISTETDDLGRPVAFFETFLHPDESASVMATFAGDGEFGPLEVRTTPMIRGTDVSTSSACS